MFNVALGIFDFSSLPVECFHLLQLDCRGCLSAERQRRFSAFLRAILHLFLDWQQGEERCSPPEDELVIDVRNDI